MKTEPVVQATNSFVCCLCFVLFSRVLGHNYPFSVDGGLKSFSGRCFPVSDATTKKVLRQIYPRLMHWLLAPRRGWQRTGGAGRWFSLHLQWLIEQGAAPSPFYRHAWYKLCPLAGATRAGKCPSVGVTERTWNEWNRLRGDEWKKEPSLHRKEIGAPAIIAPSNKNTRGSSNKPKQRCNVVMGYLLKLKVKR